MTKSDIPDRGWTVLGAAVIGLFMTTPGQTVGVSPFIDPFTNDLGIARGEVILLYSLGTLLGILPAPAIGRLVDKYGPRRIISFVAIALGTSCVAIGSATGPWSLAFAFILLRGSAIGGLSLTTLNMVNVWFDRWRGRATAIAMLGLAFGGMIIPRFAEYVTIGYGWRAAYFALGTIVVAIMLPVGVMLYRNHPKEYRVIRPRSTDATDGERGVSLVKAAQTSPFWYLLCLAVLSNAVGTALLLDHVRLLESTGSDRQTAIGLLGVVPLTLVVATLVGGLLVDKLGAIRTGFLGVGATTLTLGCVMTTPQLLAGLVYVISLGVALGLIQVAQSAGLAEQFGTRHLGTIQGTTFVVGIFGAALGPVPLAWSPQLAYWIFAAFAALTIVFGCASLRYGARG